MFGNFFSRINHSEPNNEISYESKALKEFVDKWKENSWIISEKEFLKYLEKAGVKAPYRFYEFNRKENSFKCLTRRIEEFEISILSVDSNNCYPKIMITKDGVTQEYEIDYDHLDADGNLFQIRNMGKILRNSSKVLESTWNRGFCSKTLKFGTTGTLSVQVNEPHFQYGYVNDEIKCTRNSDKIDEYLLSIDPKEKNALQIYEKIIEFLEFSSKDIEQSTRIQVLYSEKSKEEVIEKSKILVVKGKIQEYALFKDNATFHVFNNSNWKYVSDPIKISFCAKTGKYEILISGDENTVLTANQSECMKKVKETISKLWQYVK